MVERETREAAQERILTLQGELMERLEANQTYQELDFVSQDLVKEMLTPQLTDPKDKISALLKDIHASKKIIHYANEQAMRDIESTELCEELVRIEYRAIQGYLQEIKLIQKGEFEWVI